MNSNDDTTSKPLNPNRFIDSWFHGLHSWLGLFAEIGKVVVDVMHAANMHNRVNRA
jgi:hypothetical protein